MLRLLITGLLCIFSLSVISQEKDLIVVFAKVDGSDTIPSVNLKTISVYTLKEIENKRQQRRLTKLIRNIKIVYPYAKLAGIKLKEYEILLTNADSDKERKKLMKQAEQELKEEYSDDLRNMTFSQGKILIKLVYRETGTTSYELVQELRGKFTAFFWQTFARIFGFNLKSGYDPYGEDMQIEAIVRLIEAGEL